MIPEFGETQIFVINYWKKGWRPFNKAILLADNGNFYLIKKKLRTVLGYPTRDYILAPILNPTQQKEKEYNKSHRKYVNFFIYKILNRK